MTFSKDRYQAYCIKRRSDDSLTCQNSCQLAEDEEDDDVSNASAGLDLDWLNPGHWLTFENVFQRKLEKLFFASLQLENGVGGPRGLRFDQ
jgi:hypothetical protein